MATESVERPIKSVGFRQPSAGKEVFCFRVSQAARAADLENEAHMLEDACRRVLLNSISTEEAIDPMTAYLMEFALDAAAALREAVQGA